MTTALVGIREFHGVQLDLWCGPEELFVADFHTKVRPESPLGIDAFPPPTSISLSKIHLAIVVEDELATRFLKLVKDGQIDLGNIRRISFIFSNLEDYQKMVPLFAEYFPEEEFGFRF